MTAKSPSLIYVLEDGSGKKAARVHPEKDGTEKKRKDQHHTILSACLKPVICLFNIFGVFPVQFDGGCVVVPRRSRLLRGVHACCGLGLAASLATFCITSLLWYRAVPKTCLGSKFDAIGVLLNEWGYALSVAGVVYAGQFGFRRLEAITVRFRDLERETRIICGKPKFLEKPGKLFLSVLFMVLANSVEAFMNIEHVVTGKRIFTNNHNPWMAFLDYAVFTPIWMLGFVYMLILYGSFIWLFDCLTEEIERRSSQPSIGHDVIHLRVLHDRLGETVGLVNKHAGPVSLSFLIEEVTYAVLMFRDLLLAISPDEAARAVRMTCIFLRCIALAWVCLRLNRSIQSPREYIDKLLREHPANLQLRNWNDSLAAESVGATIGGIRVTASFLFGLLNTCTTYVLLLVQFEASDGALTSCGKQ